MAKTIVGMFDSLAEAHSAVRELVDMGVSRDDISLIAGDTKGEYTTKTGTAGDEMSGAATGAGTGAVLGGLGGLLVGLGTLAIPGVGPLIAAGPLATTLLGAGVGAAAGGLLGSLIDVGVPEEEANYYAEGVRRGGVLVSVRAEDEMMVDRAVNILERHNAVDVQRRATEWQKAGWHRFDPNAEPYKPEGVQRQSTATTTPLPNPTAAQKSPSTAASTTHTTTATTAPRATTASTTSSATGVHASTTGTHGQSTTAREQAIPVVEEELQVGKRAVNRGGVRVFSRVVEKPVEERVQLREENVSVERRPVNRNLSAGENAAFKEDVIEVRETDEEAVVAKQARVVEEVVVRKDVEQRTETVRDTVRRTEVNVENLGTTPGQGVTDFTTFANDFRNDFTSKYGKRGYSYDRYEPAYRYGYTLANDKRYAGKDWSAIEADARRDWEKNHQRTAWEDFKESIRYGWERVKGYSPAEATARAEAHSSSSSAANTFDTYANEFRNDFTSKYGKRGYTYDRYEPAYRYGYTLANDKRYAGKDWAAIEADARRDWEKNHQGSAWEDFKESIRYGWERVKGYSPSEASARSQHRAA
jgi:uncharacterized protein (TIGR02271 family)